jgi:hypothetical protein
MGESLNLALSLALPAGAPPANPLDILGAGPEGLRFTIDRVTIGGTPVRVETTSGRTLPRRIDKLDLAIDWTANNGGTVSPATTHNVVYVTMARPNDEDAATVQEHGVTLKRMDLAVSWVAPLRTLRPHSIVRGLMAKFPYYALRPSPKVPRKYHHPTYFNDEGGAWPMADYVEETGECQAIVRLVSGVLAQLGVPGEARTVVVWSDPMVNGGRSAVSAYWDEDPSAGLDRTKMVQGRRWLATLVDGPVEVGKTYPPSHTIMPDGNPSPGFNRYEACLEFTHEGVTRLYGGGAGIYPDRQSVLQAFWGLVWVSEGPNEGFKVEEIVRQYRR